MKKKLNICNIYILLWCLYQSQGSLGMRGEMIPRLSLVVILAISVYYAFYAIRHYNIRPFLKAVIVFLAILEIYGVFLMVSGERITFASMNAVSNYTYLKGLAISILPIFPFYVFARKGLLTEKLTKRWVWVLLVVATSYFFYLRNRVLMAQFEMGSDIEEITNNAGYLFLALLPFTVFFRNKPLLQYAMMSYCMLFILLGFKRGAIIIGAIVIVICAFDTIKHTKGKIKTKSKLLTGVLIVIGIYLVQYLLNTSDYFNARIDETLEGGSSGRDRIYSALYYHFINHTNFFQLLFGSGALSSIKIAGNYAHNDWLELLVNQGLLGVLVYAVYWKNAFMEWRRSDKTQSYSLALGTLLLSLFLESLFSMSYGNMEFYSTMLFGYCLSQNHKREALVNHRIVKKQIEVS